MAVTVKVVRATRTLKDEIYLVEIARGLGVTLRHLFANLLARRETTTVQYPEEKAAYPARFRGLHRLMEREDGRVRCVACYMCSTACPSRCIHIEAAESDDPRVEKFPVVFEIDELRCVVCGLCVEACPCDAIRMDTGIHMRPVLARGDALLGKADLLKIPPERNRGAPPLTAKSVATQGGRSPGWQSLPPDPRFPEA